MKTLCTYPGCNIVVEGRKHRCPKHRAPSNQTHDARRGSASSRGYDSRWSRIRAVHLAIEPLCRACKAKGFIVVATQVDHMVPLASGGTHAEDNLQSLCASCHSIKTGRERRMG